MPVLERPKARCRAGGAIDGRASGPGKQIDALRPIRSIAEDEEHSASPFDEPEQPFGRALRDRRIIEDHDGRFREHVRGDCICLHGRDLEPRRLAQRQRARQIQAGLARRSRSLCNHDADRILRREHEVKGVVAE